MKLKGKTVIVTGASSGIGRETARLFAKKGCNVVLASRNQRALKELAAELKGLPGKALVAPTDVTDRETVNRMAWTAVDEFDGIDVLVNNAGVGLAASLAEGEIEHIRRVFEVNVFGAVNCIQAVAPHMKEHRSGTIVNVSSVVGRLAVPYAAAYSATKAALNAMTDALRLELQPYGITVTAVYPGLTNTSFGENSTVEVERPGGAARYLRGVKAEAVAQTIVKAVKEGKRAAYVSLRDATAVGVKSVAPGLVDWGMERFWLRGRRPPDGRPGE